jgi:hypothetical protein
MSELHRFTDGANQTNWMRLVMQSAVAGTDEAKAILAAHNEIVEGQRKASLTDDIGPSLDWKGGDPMWEAAAGDFTAVVVTDDDEDSTYSYQAWIADMGATGTPKAGCGPQGCYTLRGARGWCSDRLAGLMEVSTA